MKNYLILWVLIGFVLVLITLSSSYAVKPEEHKKDNGAEIIAYNVTDNLTFEYKGKTANSTGNVSEATIRLPISPDWKIIVPKIIMMQNDTCIENDSIDYKKLKKKDKCWEEIKPYKKNGKDFNKIRLEGGFITFDVEHFSSYSLNGTSEFDTISACLKYINISPIYVNAGGSCYITGADNFYSINKWNINASEMNKSDLSMAFDFNINKSGGEYTSDDSNNHLDGNISTGMVWNENSYYGGGYDFNGDDYINISGQFDFSNGGAISMWINSSGCPAGCSAFLIGNNIQAHMPWQDNVLYFDWGGARVTTDFAPYLNKWVNVVLMSNDGTKQDIYINGVLMAEGASAPSGALDGLTIGKANLGGTDYYFEGMIDQFRIWNRTFSKTEIEALYAGDVQKYNLSENGIIFSNSTYETAGNFLASYSPQNYTWYSNNFYASYSPQNYTRNISFTNTSTANTTGMILGYSMDVNTTDYYAANIILPTTWDSRRQFNGTLNPKPTPINRSGVIDNCMNFDGYDDDVTTASTVPLNTSKNKNVSLVAWVYMNGTAPKGATALGRTVMGRYATTTTYMSLFVNSSGAVCAIDNLTQIMTPAYNISNNTWQHLACTYNCSILTLYVNGTPVSTSQANSTAITNYAQGWFIGAIYAGALAPANVWNGSIDEVRIYNRSLEGWEVNNSYLTELAGFSSNISTQGQILFYSFNVTNTNYTTNDESTQSASNRVLDAGLMRGYDTMNWTPGYYGNGYKFDYYDDWLDVTDFTLSPAMPNLSATMWIRLDKTGVANYILSGTNVNHYFVVGATNVLTFGYRNGSLNVKTCSGATALDKNWHFVGFSISNITGDMNIWLDGRNDTASDCKSPFLNGNFTTAVYLAYFGRSTTVSAFNGTMDEIRIYNRTLTPAEVSESYSGRKDSYNFSNVQFRNWSNELISTVTSDDTFINQANGTDNYTGWIYGDSGTSPVFGAGNYANLTLYIDEAYATTCQDFAAANDGICYSNWSAFTANGASNYTFNYNVNSSTINGYTNHSYLKDELNGTNINFTDCIQWRRSNGAVEATQTENGTLITDADGSNTYDLWLVNDINNILGCGAHANMTLFMNSAFPLTCQQIALVVGGRCMLIWDNVFIGTGLSNYTWNIPNSSTIKDLGVNPPSLAFNLSESFRTGNNSLDLNGSELFGNNQGIGILVLNNNNTIRGAVLSNWSVSLNLTGNNNSVYLNHFYTDVNDTGVSNTFCNGTEGNFYEEKLIPHTGDCGQANITTRASNSVIEWKKQSSALPLAYYLYYSSDASDWISIGTTTNTYYIWDVSDGNYYFKIIPNDGNYNGTMNWSSVMMTKSIISEGGGGVPSSSVAWTSPVVNISTSWGNITTTTIKKSRDYSNLVFLLIILLWIKLVKMEKEDKKKEREKNGGSENTSAERQGSQRAL